jgi:ribonuclease BN (tRNA processing enzyme)
MYSGGNADMVIRYRYSIIILAVVGFLNTGGIGYSQNDTADTTRVVLLGSGTPNAEPDRSGTAVAVVVGETSYIVDFGPGVVRRASAAYQKGIAGLEVSKLTTAFLTHLHSDHTTGYPDLILTPWVLGRDRPLTVFGPRGLRAMTEHILEAYKEDIGVRINGLEPINTQGYRVDVHEIESGVVYKDSNVTVRAFPVHHGAWHHAFGYRFETRDRVVVISGDRTPRVDIAQHCQGCDVLVHEVYSVKGFKTRPAVWQAYHADSHTSSIELGKLAARVRPKVLVLYHQLLWGATPQDVLEEIHRVYDGTVIYGNDLDVF